MNIASVFYVVFGIIMCLISAALLAQLTLSDTEIKVAGALAALSVGLFQIQLALTAQTRGKIDAIDRQINPNKDSSYVAWREIWRRRHEFDAHSA